MQQTQHAASLAVQPDATMTRSANTFRFVLSASLR